MRATEWDMMRLSEAFDGEFDPADFTPEELDGMLGLLNEGVSAEEIRARYFEYYDDIKDRTLNRHKWSD